MKEWCLEHPYMTFVIIVAGISTVGNIATKIVDVFVKPSPTTVNMNIDPTKIPGFSSAVVDQSDDIVH